MKISLEWLGDYLPGERDAQRLADALTNGGLPVELIEKHGDDTVIDVEVTSNRGDCLCHIGVARELAALLDRPFKDVAIALKESSEPAAGAVSVRIDAPALCPHYTARVIKGVKIAQSPAWLARRLDAVGLRPINNVVDITNYVMFEMGQPLHAFDFAHVRGRQIIVRNARKGETLVSIDGHTRTLSPDMLVIADAERPVALAGVMGGKESEVSDQTTDVLLESARFDPLSIRKTARALAMKSDSSYRFERGIDPTLPERASRRAAQLICELAGGQLLSGVVQAGGDGYTRKTLIVRLERIRRLLGVELGDAIVAAYRRLGLSPVREGEIIRVDVPSHRLDLNIEADLIEEAARVVGYDKIPVREQIEIRLTPPRPEQVSLDAIRTSACAAGFFEAITFSFISDLLAGDFVPAGASLPRTDPNVRKADAQLRPSLLPGLLEAVRRNETVGAERIRLFEIGSVFWIEGGRLEQGERLAMVSNVDLRDVRGAAEAILARLDRERAVEVVPADRAGLARGIAGEIRWGGRAIGHLGRIAPAIADKLDLRGPVYGVELRLDALLAGMKHVPQLRPLPRFPAIRRDLSLVVPESTTFAAIESALRKANPEGLESLEYVTTYRGKPLEKGQKSVTVTLVFRSESATLTSEQVEPVVQRAIDSAKQTLGATLRGA
jgi:phenylalanyl-tRNA synthetase beta chain